MGNLDRMVTKNMLGSQFERFGCIIGILQHQRHMKDGSGFDFINFKGIVGAEKAINFMQNW